MALSFIKALHCPQQYSKTVPAIHDLLDKDYYKYWIIYIMLLVYMTFPGLEITHLKFDFFIYTGLSKQLYSG